MKICATNKSASLTGIHAGLIGLTFAPSVDTGSALWLVVAAIAFAVPAYFFVFGVRHADMVGLWIFETELLKRLALCCAGVVCTYTLVQIILIVLSGR